MSTPLHVAVVGATGAVGRELVETLERRSLPVSRLSLFASARSAGRRVPFRGEELDRLGADLVGDRGVLDQFDK